jgi:hypothetical protein
MGKMPAILYVLSRLGRSVKGAIRIMEAKDSWLLVLALGWTKSFGKVGEEGSAKYRALAAVTAVPRDWPRRTVREVG